MKKLLVSVLVVAMLCGQAAVYADKIAESAQNEETKIEQEVQTDETDADVTEDVEVDEANETDEDAGDTENTENADAEKITVDNFISNAIVTGEDVVAPQNAQVTVNVTMIYKMKVTDSVAAFELCDANGEVIGEKVEWIGGVTKEFKMVFDLPSVNAGDKYKLRLKSGLNYIQYYDKMYGVGDEIELEAYGYRNENGEPCVSSEFSISACPLYEHAIVPYIAGVQLKLYPEARLINGVAMAPVRHVAEELGLKVRYDERYHSVVCEIDGKQAIFNVGTAYATIMGNDCFMPAPCEIIDDTAFVPIRTLAEAFDCTVEALDFGDHIDVCMSESPIVKEYYMNLPVNRWGISSRTNYMVWIDKSDFRVRVYQGSKGKWEEIKSFPCAIGAPGSPTITGSFEYEYRMPQWSYSGYYVGPCLVFYGNYAMHSTLIQYNGVPYDDRVGVMISHGCVRLHKSDIDWLDRNLPQKSRIYITE